MVLIRWYLRICCEHMKENRSFWREKITVTALNLFKCLNQIRTQKLILTCAPISELPSNISTMLCRTCYKSKFKERIFISSVEFGLRKNYILVIFCSVLYSSQRYIFVVL